MCGRFTLMTQEECRDIEAIVQEVAARTGEDAFPAGRDVYPTNKAPVLLARGGVRRAELLRWGFPAFKGSGVLINARAETVQEKKTFRACLPQRRCVVPSAGFYEWDGQKRKFLFRQEGHGVYMAGLYSVYDGVPCFVILTTAANPSVAAVHHRMPVVLAPERVDEWLFDYGAAMRLLAAVPPPLAGCMA